jgi:hypothetical protein
MQSAVKTHLPILFGALGLSAVAAPTWAVVAMTFGDEITHAGAYRVTPRLALPIMPAVSADRCQQLRDKKAGDGQSPRLLPVNESGRPLTNT